MKLFYAAASLLLLHNPALAKHHAPRSLFESSSSGSATETTNDVRGVKNVVSSSLSMSMASIEGDYFAEVSAAIVSKSANGYSGSGSKSSKAPSKSGSGGSDGVSKSSKSPNVSDKSGKSSGGGSDGSKSSKVANIDVDWEELSTNLSLGTEIEDVTTQAFLDSCTEEFSIPYNRRTNSHLQFSDPSFINPNSNQTSPLCMASLFCAFHRCNPTPDQAQQTLLQEALMNFDYNANLQALGQDPPPIIWDTAPANSKEYEWVKNSTNPSSNLPLKAFFPRNANDVVSAVNFARENRVQISIKNSGHDYAGRSTKKGTLLLNMKKYHKYSSDSIVTCPQYEYFPKGDPCRLAKARNKPGYIRVGGGENFAEMYSNVRKYNEAFGYPFTAFGGASTTVSPFGYSMLSGLSGTTGGRRRGFGADQILKIEMVLASGQHVRFGPTEWKPAVGPQIYPQTTAVNGECLEDDEWGKCDFDIPFELLWKSVRGGGPGWGVVLSFYFQLHTYEQYEIATFNGVEFEGVCSGLTADYKPYLKVLSAFFIAYFMQDEEYFSKEDDKYAGADGYTAYGEVSFEKITACSTPAFAGGSMFCDGEGTAEQAVTTYTTFVSNWNVVRSEDRRFDLTDDEMQLFQECAVVADLEPNSAWIDVNQQSGGGKPNRFDPEIIALEEELGEGYNPQQYCFENPTKCIPAEFDGPDMVPPVTLGSPILFPASLAQTAFDKYNITVNYIPFGPGTKHGSDGMDSVTSAYRNAGFWTPLFFEDYREEFLSYDDTFFAGAFQEFFQPDEEERDEDGNILLPPFINSMHASPVMHGPMKNDTKKACPLDMPLWERDEKCFSLIEAVYGSKQLNVLMAAKGEIDPHNMFSCDFCVTASLGGKGGKGGKQP